MQADSSIAVTVIQGDALAWPSDVLVLKHAQGLYGVDRVVHSRLAAAGIRVDLPAIGAWQLLRPGAAVASERVLFVGVQPIARFEYGEIREFGQRTLRILSDEVPGPRHVTMTIHGPGYGLDESESFESQLAGVMDAIDAGECPRALERLTFVERDRSRVERLSAVLRRLLPTGRLQKAGGRGPAGLTGLSVAAESAYRTAGHGSAAKPRVFVAMPFAEEMSDLFHYGIQGAVNGAGLLAERADLSSFTGDVMDWVRSRISSAKLVVADLTSSNPNVFLEVGYAWGKGIPTVLIAHKTETLKFDVQGQRCIQYSSIKDLEQRLKEELIGLGTQG